MSHLFFGEFDSLNDIVSAFALNPGQAAELAYAEPLVAGYFQVDYEGAAAVVFRLGGVWWEVWGSHCSCLGLEGQWEPEETSPEAVLVWVDAQRKLRHKLLDEQFLDAVSAAVTGPGTATAHMAGQ